MRRKVANSIQHSFFSEKCQKCSYLFGLFSSFDEVNQASGPERGHEQDDFEVSSHDKFWLKWLNFHYPSFGQVWPHSAFGMVGCWTFFSACHQLRRHLSIVKSWEENSLPPAPALPHPRWPPAAPRQPVKVTKVKHKRPFAPPSPVERDSHHPLLSWEWCARSVRMRARASVAWWRLLAPGLKNGSKRVKRSDLKHENAT